MKNKTIKKKCNKIKDQKKKDSIQSKKIKIKLPIMVLIQEIDELLYIYVFFNFYYFNTIDIY